MKQTVISVFITVAVGAAAFSASAISTSVLAQVAVKEPWVRATVPQQKATGAFMQLTAPADSKLIEVKSPVAVRYAWEDNPECNLANGAGLPASPFRTEQINGFRFEIPTR